MKKLVIVFSLFFTAFAMAQEIPCDPDVGIPSGNATLMLSDREPITPLEIYEPIWKSLERMSSDERMNAEIELELEQGAIQAALKMADRIENLWNSYKFDKALALFPELEKLTDINEMSIGNAWRTPIITEEVSLWGTDRRIGTRDSVYVTAFDIHRESCNLFAILLFQGDGSNTGWAMNHSTNGGYTWNETYIWGASYHINSLSASVLANHCYIAFSRGSSQDQAFLYRVRVSDGTQENFSDGQPYQTVLTTTSPEYIKEVALTSSQDLETWSYRLYYLVITSTGELRYFYDDEEAVSWSGILTGIYNADKGLDVCMNEGYGADERWLWASYIDGSDVLHIDASVGWTGAWTPMKSYAIGSSPRYSSISAYHDTITSFFEFDGTVNHCRYLVSYDGGDNFLWGVVDDTTTMSESPDLSSRKGAGVGLVWRYYSDPREGHFNWRFYSGWPWPPAETYTDHPPYYNKPSIEYLEGGFYGVVYTCWNTPYIRAAYFDKGLGGSREYLLGDVNMYNGAWPPTVVGGDVTYLVNYFRMAPTSIHCPLYDFWASADVNGDCNVIGSDVTKLVGYFRGIGSLQWCPEYEPTWKTPADLPVNAPCYWPGCSIIRD